jgi:hypothetical protein
MVTYLADPQGISPAAFYYRGRAEPLIFAFTP